MLITNLTPHTLNVLTVEGNFLTIPPSGKVARVSTETLVVDKVLVEDPALSADLTVSVAETRYHDTYDLPEPVEGVMYVTSFIVAQAAAREGRTDVLSPGKLIRDPETGQPSGCEGLSRPVV